MRGEQASLLVVEDNPVAGELLSRWLREARPCRLPLRRRHPRR